MAADSPRAPICLTPEERARLAALYPPDPEPERAVPAPRAPFRSVYAKLKHVRPRGLGVRGENNGKRVLTQAMVEAMRLEAATGMTCRDSARRHGVAPNTALHAIRGDSWAWMTSPPPVKQDQVKVADGIRAILRRNVLTEWRAGQIRVGTASSDQIRVALHRMVKSGEVERTGRGLYRAMAIGSTP